MNDIPAPVLEWDLIAPLMVLGAVAVVGVLLEAFVPRGPRFVVQASVAIGGVVAALGTTIWTATRTDVLDGDVLARGQVAAEGALSVDGPSLFTWGLLLVLALLSMLLFAERRLGGGLSAFTGRAADAPGSSGEAEATRHRLEHTEVFPLALFALLGMMLFAASTDLLMMFVALEVLSLPLYVLCGLARRRRLLSQEAALKYFLLGAFSSAFFLYGVALVYGYAGGFGLAEVADAVASRTQERPLLLAGVALLAVGLLFKVGAVPFHSWTPDVYQGAPTPVTAFMAAGTKAAAVVALARVLLVAFGGAEWDWQPAFWAVAALTMLVGAVGSIAQGDVKRMLAYSSIAHAGFILVGVVGATGGDGITSVSSALFYLTAYGVATIGAFAVVMLVRDASGESTDLETWTGLGRRAPWLAGAFALFMLSFAGIPLTAGFIGKWGVFSAAWAGGLWPLVVLGVLVSAVAAFFYVRVVLTMFFDEPRPDGPLLAVPGAMTTVVVTVAAVATVALGVMPGPVLDLAQQAGAFVR